MRTTLNDELMHEAGFETDSWREFEKRRARRRRHVLFLIGLIAWAVTAAPLTLLGIPRVGGLVTFLWLPAPLLAFWFVKRVRERLGWDEEGHRL